MRVYNDRFLTSQVYLCLIDFFFLFKMMGGSSPWQSCVLFQDMELIYRSYGGKGTIYSDCVIWMAPISLPRGDLIL